MSVVNSFHICPKCGVMHDTRVLVCTACKFEHAIVAEVAADLPPVEVEVGKATVTIVGDPIAKTAGVSVEIPIDAPVDEPLVITAPDPTDG